MGSSHVLAVPKGKVRATLSTVSLSSTSLPRLSSLASVVEADQQACHITDLHLGMRCQTCSGLNPGEQLSQSFPAFSPSRRRKGSSPVMPGWLSPSPRSSFYRRGWGGQQVAEPFHVIMLSLGGMSGHNCCSLGRGVRSIFFFILSPNHQFWRNRKCPHSKSCYGGFSDGCKGS